MFDQHVRYGARTRPLTIALSDGHAHITYRQLDDAVDQVAAAFVREGIGAGAIVGVALADGYTHALAALAAARLGLGSASLYPPTAAGAARLAGVTHLVADDPALAPAILASPEWFAAARAAPPAPPPPVRIDLDATARVQLSSGATGVPKAVALSWATMLLRGGVGSSMFGYDARTLSMIGLESGGFAAWTATWRNQGTVLVPPPDPAALARMLPILQPTAIVAAPVQIAALADALDDEAQPLMHAIHITVSGGRVSRAVREKLAIRLGAALSVSYASTEAGTVAAGTAGRLPDPRDVGYLRPGITVEVVDDAGRPLPAGATGLLRIAGVGVIDGYMDGEPTPAFRDGWFYPGDLGSLGPDGLLRIIGRADEVINVGGEKISPETLEEQARLVPGIADVAAFALPGERGDEPWLAIVRSGEVTGEAIAEALGNAVSVPGLGAVKIAWIDAIPRTPMGKPRRAELQAAARALPA